MKRIARIYEHDQEVFVLAFENETAWLKSRSKGRAVEPYVALERSNAESDALWRRAQKLRAAWFDDVYLHPEIYAVCPFVVWEKSAALFTFWAREEFDGCEFLQDAISPLSDELVA